MTNQRTTISRRRFVGKTVAAMSTGLAAPYFVPRHVLSAPGKPGANDRIITGHIGIGGKGSTHVRGMTDHIGALCDADSDHLAKAAHSVNRKVRTYADYRHLLDDQEIDAVVIATPDHWHGLMAIQACEAGKDVYVEKPACKTIEEGRAMVQAAEHHGRVVQVGSQGRNHPAAKALHKYLTDGMIGRVTRVVCWHNDNPVGGDPLKMGPPPKNLDWDLWLGPAADRLYNPDYCHRNFRWMLDLGGGQIRDRGAHVFSLVSWFLGLDRTGPRRITASGNRPPEGLWNCPTNFKVTYQFEDPDLTIVWEQPGTPAADFDFGAVYHGTKGKTIVRGGDGRVFPEEKVLKYAAEQGLETELPMGVRADDYHRKDWLDCLRTRSTPGMDIETGHRVASMCILANLSYRLQRPVHWDPVRERIEGDSGANLLLGMPGRQEFRL